MNILNALFKTSIGRKVIMAVTGVILIGFIIGHLVGNLQIFSAPEKINEYAHFLQSLGPALWVIRGFLLLTVGLHIWSAAVLTIENKKARGGSYKQQRTLRASYASRTMRVSGIIVLAFLIYHLLHFTAKTTHGGDYYPTVMLHGEQVPDVHSMMVFGFQQPVVSIFYLVAIALLSMHLYHGFSSMFQSIGLRSRTWAGCLNKLSLLFCILYFIGNAAIVGAVWSGYVKIENPELEARLAGLCTPNCQVCEERIASYN